MALCLTVREGQRVRLRLGELVVWVTMVPRAEHGKANRPRLAFEAPRSVEILREKLIGGKCHQGGNDAR